MECPKCHSKNPKYNFFCVKCGTTLHSSEEIPVSYKKAFLTLTKRLITGSTFAGRYQIIKELGKSGMGREYRVLDKKTNEEVMLKLIRPEIAANEKIIERFGNEIKLVGKIIHKNVCRVYHLGEEEGIYYFIQEFVQGMDLKAMIGMLGQLSVVQSLSIAKQVCEGLGEAHRLGVIHCNLKPSNIMIDKEGSARIMDFGIASCLKKKDITDAGVMIEMLKYMSPEQAKAKEVGKCSDIYSLRIILYEMLTGRVPSKKEMLLIKATKHKDKEPQGPKELTTQSFEELGQVILKYTKKKSKRRYQTAEELLTELIRIEKGFTTVDRTVNDK